MDQPLSPYPNHMQLSPYEQFQLLQQQQQQQQQQNFIPQSYPEEWFEKEAGEDTTKEYSELIENTRLANTALSSWDLLRDGMKRTNSRLSLSGRGGFSNSDLKTFLSQKGKTDLTDSSGLYRAASKGNATAIMNAVKREGLNAPLNVPDENGYTPLMYAALADSETSIEMLLNLSVKREQVDATGRTAVHYAAFFGRAKALKFLIESGSDWTHRDVYGRTPLHWAPSSKNIKCMSILLDYARIVNGDINPKDNEGMTPVHCTAQMGTSKHVVQLIEANCDFSDVDIEGKTALHWTVENKDLSCLHTIVEYYPHLLNKQDNNGQTLLHLSAKKGYVLLVEQLLNIEGIEIDTRDREDRTPQHLACMESHGSVTNRLVTYHALDSCIDSYGLTALHYAVHVNSIECVMSLVRSGYATHIPSANERGITPLILAAECGFNEILKALLEKSHIVGEINHCDLNGSSALHCATQGGFVDCIIALLQNGSDPNLLDKTDMSPLDVACEGGQYLCIEPLMRGGAIAETYGKDGFTSFHRAILYKDLQVVHSLIDAGCKTETLDSNGRSPLELAVYAGNKEVTVLLLQLSSVDPNSMNRYGLTTLHIAASEGHAEVLKLLLVNGGYANNIDDTDNRYTPLDYAKQNNHSECMQILQAKGGLTVHEIQTIAAVWIQSAYRKYRAKQLAERLRYEKEAAICIQSNVKAMMQRRKYLMVQKEIKSSVKIQSFVRGFLARKTFKKLMQKHYEGEKQRQMIEDFGHMFLSLQSTEPIVIDTVPLTRTKGKVEDKEEKERIWQMKVEQCLRMRERYLREQQEWVKFRMLEKQRREDRVRQEEQARLTNIIKNSRERRKYFQEKFKYSFSVQSCHQAAVVIQRAYRDLRGRRERKRREEEAEKMRQKSYHIWAAHVIQRSWRWYREWKMFETNHLDSILTGPVITMPTVLHKLPLPLARSYERSTIVSGTRRHKLHKTHQSGFKIFKPLPSQTCTRPSTKAQNVKPLEVSLSPRMETMIHNWPWSRRLLLQSNNIKLPTIAQHPDRHSNSSFTVATEPLKLPQLKIN